MEVGIMKNINDHEVEKRRHFNEDEDVESTHLPEDDDFGLSETELTRIRWMSMYDHSQMAPDEWLNTLDTLVDDLYETTMDLEAGEDELEEKIDDLKDSIDTLADTEDSITDMNNRLDLHKAAIIGLFGVQILLSVLYFCSRHKMGRSIHGMKDKAV
jgi:hypothetical protein